MKRDKIMKQTCCIRQCTNKGMLMYIACLCPNLVYVLFMQSLYYASNFLN